MILPDGTSARFPAPAAMPVRSILTVYADLRAVALVDKDQLIYADESKVSAGTYTLRCSGTGTSKSKAAVASEQRR